jgi:hypothetical protein
MTRFDIPETVANVIKVATESNIIDALDIYGMAIDHNDNWYDLVEEICEIAYCNCHTNKEAHSAVVRAAEEYWKVM